MGLDMYLTAERYIWSSEKPISDEVANLLGLQLDGERMRVNSVEAEAMYWRKANAIHKWFVENIQGGEDNCQRYYVEREQLVELRDLCAKLCTQREMAEETLPTADGFFFGPTDYDEWYWDGIEETVQGLDKALKTFDDKWQFHYRSSW